MSLVVATHDCGYELVQQLLYLTHEMKPLRLSPIPKHENAFAEICLTSDDDVDVNCGVFAGQPRKGFLWHRDKIPSVSLADMRWVGRRQCWTTTNYQSNLHLMSHCLLSHWTVSFHRKSSGTILLYIIFFLFKSQNAEMVVQLTPNNTAQGKYSTNQSWNTIKWAKNKKDTSSLACRPALFWWMDCLWIIPPFLSSSSLSFSVNIIMLVLLFLFTFPPLHCCQSSHHQCPNLAVLSLCFLSWNISWLQMCRPHNYFLKLAWFVVMKINCTD